MVSQKFSSTKKAEWASLTVKNMSRAIDKPLDEADPIEQSYCLEVSSPGIERELTRDFHFECAMDCPIKLRLIRPDEKGRREFAGVLKEF